MSTSVKDAALLEVENLGVSFHLESGTFAGVRDVSFTVNPGETLALVGESGSGKSVTARAVMGLVDPPGEIVSGSVKLDGKELIGIPQERLRKLRGPRISMVFQDALSALNPVFPVGYQISEMFRTHEGLSRNDAKARSIALLDRVRIPDAARRYNQFPHEYSGGMRQRAMIAMSIALSPDVLIADEPTTALDVTVQDQIMNLIAELQEDHDMGVILITHDLGVVAQQADKVAVMYAGRIAEEGPVKSIFRAASHGYTQALLNAIPNHTQRGKRLETIPGSAPQIGSDRTGCPFAPRCSFAVELCENVLPPAVVVGDQHRTNCHEWSRIRDAK